ETAAAGRPAPAKAVPLRRPTTPAATATATPLPVAPLTPPPPAPATPLHAPAPQPAPAPDTTSAPPVQRLFGLSRGRTTRTLAAAAAHAAILPLNRTQGSPQQAPPDDPPPAYSPTPPPNDPPAQSAGSARRPEASEPPPGYTSVPEGGLDPNQLTEFQLDALVNRIIGRVTRLVRTELRMDRERIGRLRDPR
ncbi:hypothetical protein ACWGPH_37580, partial [Streptomyces sp. NPDC055733]